MAQLRGFGLDSAVALILIGKVEVANILDVPAHRFRHQFVEVEVSAQKSWIEFVREADHIVDHEDLTVDISAGTDANRRDVHRCGHTFREVCWDLLENDGEAACLFEQLRICDQFLRLFLLARAHGVGAEFVDGLRGQTQMTHHWDSRGQDAFDGFDDLRTSLEFDRVCPALLHDPNRTVERAQRISLIGTEGHVTDDERALDPLDHALGVVDHLVEGDRHRRVVARHHIGCGITDQEDVDSRAIEDARHREVIRGEHGDLLTDLLHLEQGIGGDLLRLPCDGHLFTRPGEQRTLLQAVAVATSPLKALRAPRWRVFLRGRR